MKTTYLILALLAAATAWAESQKPLAFFTKINNTYAPLCRVNASIDDESGIGLMSYGNPSCDLVEFIYQDDYAITSDPFAPGYVGFYFYVFAFGPSIPKISLNLDTNSKVTGHTFYSCESSGSTEHVISSIKVKEIECSPTDIYLLAYDRKTKSPLPGQNEPSEEEKNVAENEENVAENEENVAENKGKETPSGSPYYPLAFFAEAKGVYHVLSGNTFYGNSIFSYGKPHAVATEFTFQDGYAFTNSSSSPGYAGFDKYTFFYGPSSTKTRLNLTTDYRVTNHPFYACVSYDRSYNVFHTDVHPLCFRVNIYLLPYDRETGSFAKFEKYLPKKEGKWTPSSKEAVKEPVKEPVKEAAKESVKEAVKESSKEPSKEAVKEQPKEPSKQPSKQPSKEPSKQPSSVSQKDASMPLNNVDTPLSSIDSTSNPEALVSSDSKKDIPASKQLSASVSSKMSDSSGPKEFDGSKSFTTSDKKSSSDCGDCKKDSGFETSNLNRENHLERNPTIAAGKTYSTAIICAECKAGSGNTKWKTYTDYTTYCPEETTLTFNVCKEVCQPSTVTVSSATTLTIPGVCIVPETNAAGDSTPKVSAEGPDTKHYVPEGSDNSPSHIKSPAENIKAGDKSLFDIKSLTENIEASDNSPFDIKSPAENIKAGDNSPFDIESLTENIKAGDNSPFDIKSPAEISAAGDTTFKDSDETNSRQFAPEASEKSPLDLENPNDTAKEGDSVPEPSEDFDSPDQKSGDLDEKNTPAVLNTLSDEPFVNGAPRNTIGARAFGIVAFVVIACA